jgi:hypothetical protein
MEGETKMKPRQVERFWSIPGVKASFSRHVNGNQQKFEAIRIWDISEQNCALEFKSTPGLQKGDVGELNLNYESGGKKINEARVERIWEGGMALSFSQEPSIREYFHGRKILGYSNNPEFLRKKDLANIEINELGAEVRQVKLCQFHLFFACFTISMALASFLAVLSLLSRYKLNNNNWL